MLILKPKGRGNWSSVVVSITGNHAAPLLIRKGQTLMLGGITFRICEVLA